jgi:mono/diheme cytochrome c family protein
MSPKRIFVLALGLLTAELSYNVIHAHAGSAPDDGIYTAEQSQRGATAYAAKCASCHGADLDGVVPTPPLDGDEFFAKYADQPMLVLFDKIQKTMPGDHPGTLSRPETADLIAYILNSSKYPVGKIDLPNDEESLKKLQLPKPPANR